MLGLERDLVAAIAGAEVDVPAVSDGALDSVGAVEVLRDRVDQRDEALRITRQRRIAVVPPLVGLGNAALDVWRRW